MADKDTVTIKREDLEAFLLSLAKIDSVLSLAGDLVTGVLDDGLLQCSPFPKDMNAECEKEADRRRSLLDQLISRVLIAAA